MSAKQKALLKQADQEAARKQREEEEKEKREAAAWKVGAKDDARSRAEEEKEAEKRRKAAEKAALQAAEEAELSGVARTGKPKKKGKDDFDMLKAALAQQPKTKAQKAAEEKKKQDEERRKKEEEARLKKEQERQVTFYIPINVHMSNGCLVIVLGGGSSFKEGCSKGNCCKSYR